MTAVTKAKKPAKALAAKTVPDKTDMSVVLENGMTRGKAVAQISINPVAKAALTISHGGEWSFGKTEVADTMKFLEEAVARAKSGDYSDADAMLVAQAAALDTLFHQMVRRASVNFGQHLGASETYLRLALKCQSQAKSTWEAIARIHNPGAPTFVGQNNIAGGHQQVNNSHTSAEIAPSELHRGRNA